MLPLLFTTYLRDETPFPSWLVEKNICETLHAAPPPLFNFLKKLDPPVKDE